MLSNQGQQQQQQQRLRRLNAPAASKELPQLVSVDSQDERSISLRKFQEEKKSLVRVVDEEVIFEKSDDNVGDTSCSSTTPTANSWTVGEEEEDRKPAAIDISGKPGTPPSSKQASPAKSTPGSSSSSSTWPPPLISPDQEQLLAITQNQAPRKSRQKQMQLQQTIEMASTPPSPPPSATTTPTKAHPTPAEEQSSLFASLPAPVSPISKDQQQSGTLKSPPKTAALLSTSPQRVDNTAMPAQLPVSDSKAPKSVEGQVSPPSPRQLLEGQLSPPRAKPNTNAPRLERQGGHLNVKTLKQPPPPTAQQHPIISNSQSFPVHSGHHPHPPNGLQRQRGNLHVNVPQPPGNIIVHHPNQNSTRKPIMSIMSNHNNRPKPQHHPRQPPFSVSEETIQAAAMANQIQRQQRQQQRQKIKMQRLQQQQQEMQRRQKAMEEQRQENGNGGGSEDDVDELGISIAGSDDFLEDDSIVKTSSFKLAAKVLEREDFPELTRTGHSKGGMSRSRPRRISVMEADLSSIVSDPSLRVSVSEPKTSITPRRALRKPTTALAARRRMLTRDKSSRVIQNTATLSSFRSGVSSVTMDSAMKAAALRSAKQRAAAMPLRFDIQQVTLDNPSSAHSSVGYKSASYRSLLDNSAHFNVTGAPGYESEFQSSKHSNGYHNYNPQLAPHMEGDSVSAINQSTTSLDAASAISPPTREQMRKRRESVRAVQPGPMRATHRPSLQGDEMSQVSRMSAARSQASRRRPSNTSGAGLRRPPSGNPGGNGLTAGRHGIRGGESPIPVPTLVDPTKFMRRMKRENDKKDDTTWDHYLDDQNDIIMKLACELSQQENEHKVQQQQQPHPPKKNEIQSMAPSTASGQSSAPSPSHGSRSQLAIQQQLLLQQQLATGSPHLAASSPQITPANAEPMDEALKLALEESRRESRPQPVKTDSERLLEVAMEISRVEAAEFDRRRHAIPLSLDLSSPPSEGKEERETLAPVAPMESKGSAHDSEVTGTMDIALKLSQQEYNHEVSKRRPKGRLSLTPHNTGDSPARPKRNSHHDSALDYSMSTTRSLVMPSEMIEDDISTRRQPILPSVPTAEGQDALSLALAMSMVDATPAQATSSPVGWSQEVPRQVPRYNGNMVETGTRNPVPHQGPSTSGEGDELLALALALSKMDATNSLSGDISTPGESIQHLSQDESLAYALELSRRTPGAFDSRIGTPSRNSGLTPESHPRVASQPILSPPRDFHSLPQSFSPAPSHASYHSPYYDDNRNYSSRSPLSAAPVVSAGPQDEALRMALAASYEAAYGSPSPSAPSADDDSLAVALALSRRDAYGDGY